MYRSNLKTKNSQADIFYLLLWLRTIYIYNPLRISDISLKSNNFIQWKKVNYENYKHKVSNFVSNHASESSRLLLRITKWCVCLPPPSSARSDRYINQRAGSWECIDQDDPWLRLDSYFPPRSNLYWLRCLSSVCNHISYTSQGYEGDSENYYMYVNTKWA